MLKVVERAYSTPDDQPLPSKGGGIDVANLISIVRRQWPTVAACLVLGCMLSTAYCLTTSPRYTASVRIMIDTRKNNLLRNKEVLSESQLDAVAVESQVEILKSESVALEVVREQKLTQDPEFVGTGLVNAALGNFMSSERGASPPSQEELERRAVRSFVRNVAAKRVGLTYVINVDFTSESPEKSARLAAAIADAYSVGELEAKYQAVRRTSKWLQDRITELRTQATESDLAVQAFKAAHNIVDTSRGLMSEQQLGDVNSQLIQARALTAETKARLDRIREIASGDIPDATVADALRNDVIIRARAQYLDTARREAEWASRYGPNHAATINLRNQMTELKRSIEDELRRIAQTYESDHRIAKAREQSLENSLATLVEQAGTTGQAQVKLRELESSAQTYRNLYDTFLQKFEEATQQQSLPIMDARVITPATEPTGPSAPKTMLIVAAGSLLGLGIGLTIAVSCELLNTALRTPADVEEQTGLECLGTLPNVAVSSHGTFGMFNSSGLANRDAGLGDISRYVIDAPFSRFAEVIRNVKVSLDIARLAREVKTVGIISSLPKEGKTTIASNLAQLVAETGRRVLLIDGDLRNPSLTRSLAPEATAGLVEVLTQTHRLVDVIQSDPDSGLEFLPAVVFERISNTAEFLSSDAMERLLADAREKYEYVLVDLPPLMPIVDGKAAAHLIDGFVYVIEWGRTTRDAVTEALSTSQIVRERILGALLNKADAGALKRLEFYKGRNYDSYYVSERPSDSAVS